LYVAPLVAARDSSVPWQKVADFTDAVTNFAVHGDALYLLSHASSPHYDVRRTSVSHPNIASAVTVMPSGRSVLQDLWATEDGLYVQELDGGIGRLRRFEYDRDAGGRLLPLPFEGSVFVSSANATKRGLIFAMASWTESARVYRYAPERERVEDTRLAPRDPADFSDIVAQEISVPAADGTLVPLSIVHRKGIALDGTHPAILEGYGAYGIVIGANFDAGRLAWLERGGVYAVAHVRGGGELGEEWYLAGKGPTKPNSWGDFLAAAQYLVRRGYSSPRRLAAYGRSAGSIVVGRAITDRPDLFGAAVIRAGVPNMLRAEAMQSGPANVPEFGSVHDSAGFRQLWDMDAYQHVKDGVAYPAVLLTTGINDTRVAPWQSAKMAARLQAATSSRRPVLLRVERNAGHSSGTTRQQLDAELADTYAFLLHVLGT
jgi:prolyl oligopeptidase